MTTGFKNQRFSLVVVGASRGGLKALQVLLPGLASNFRLPLAVLLHRGRPAEDALAACLQKSCALPVAEAEDKESILTQRVYLAPADYHLLVEGDHFALSLDPPVRHTRPAIDVLFESAAETVGPGLIGLVLTGANDDGASGLKAIQSRGGLTLVQEPSSAECRVMPDAALAAVPDAQVLSLDQVAAKLSQLADL